MKVITVHGIRLNNKWYEKFEQVSEIQESNLDIHFFEYGYFRFFHFLFSKRREKIIDRFCEFYSNIVQDTNYPPSIIAHSFGTYIVFMAMKRYKEIKFSSIIFCGSILNSKLDFRDFFINGQVKSILNDHGNREWFLKYTRQLIDKYCGKAGQTGFSDIPPKYINNFINRENYLRHSDYFLPIRMKENWLQFLNKNRFQAEFKSEIIRPEIIPRIYQNIKFANKEFEIEEISFNARIDKSGNYFAKYEKHGRNPSEKIIDNYSFVTTADGLNKEHNMNFMAFDKSNLPLQFTFEKDQTHFKKVKIYLDKPILPKGNFHLKTYFCWHGTIELQNGDTDHWAIKGIRNVNIQLNFPYELKTPRLYEVKEKEIVGLNNLEILKEKDGSISYVIKFNNTKNLDGLIFYFEGHKSSKTIIENNKSFSFLSFENKKAVFDNPHLKNLKVKRTQKFPEFSISKANINDLKNIYKLEVDIEFSNAASEETLRDRINMFNDGFLVVKDKNNSIIGYIESIIWNEKPFDTFSEISNFPMHYNIRGNSLYIIFLAVDSKFRKKGIASKLLSEIEKITQKYEIKIIRLVAKDDLISFYSKRGFHSIKELPNFLKERNYKSILMEKILIYNNLKL